MLTKKIDSIGVGNPSNLTSSAFHPFATANFHILNRYLTPPPANVNQKIAQIGNPLNLVVNIDTKRLENG